MALDERARHELFTRVEEVLGAVPAETLFGYLPPVGWADVATKEDLRQLEDRLNARVDGIEVRMEAREHRLVARMDERFAAQARAMAQQTWAILMAVLVALVGAVVTTAFL